MRTVGSAFGVSLLGGLGLAWLGDPREHAAWVAPVVVGWGAVVAATLLFVQRGGASGPAPGPSRGLDVSAGRGAAAVVFAAALAVRLPLLCLPPTLSDDVYRYVWEGRVWAEGYSPFALAPDDPRLAPLRDDVWARVNHPSISTIYPPLAQLLFVLISPWGVAGFKGLMALADAGTAALLARRTARAGWLWALLPLPALESAANGHLEGLGALLVVVALGGSAVAAWAGAMLKLLPGVLLVRRGPRVWALAGVATVLAVLPLWGPGLTRAARNYGTHWSFNGSVYPLVTMLVGADGVARGLLTLAGVAVVGWVLVRCSHPAGVALGAFGAFVVLSPTVHPWYVLWPLAPALWLARWEWVVLAVTVPGAYHVLTTLDPTGAWRESPWTRGLVWAPFYAAWAAAAWRRFVRPGP